MTVDRMPDERDGDNPFELVGAITYEVIPPSQVNNVLSSDLLMQFCEELQMPPDERKWFNANLLALVTSFCKEAQDFKSVRSMALDIESLANKLWFCLQNPTPRRISTVRKSYALLSSAIKDRIWSPLCGPGTAPAILNDIVDLHKLYGMLPVKIKYRERNGKAVVFHTYEGEGHSELSIRGNPRDARLEQFALLLVTAFTKSTGRPAGRGKDVAFNKFFSDLMQNVCPGSGYEKADKALRRAIRLHKAMLEKLELRPPLQRE